MTRVSSHDTTGEMLEHDPYSEDTSGFFGSIAKGIGKAAGAVGKVAGKAAKVAATPITAPAHLIAKATKNIPILGTITGAADVIGSTPFRITQQVLEGGNVSKVALGNLKQALSSVKSLAPYVQTVISFVPGVGTGVSAAIGAGLALAEGQSITAAMVAGVKGALPCGAAAQSAFSIAEAAIQRKPIDQIAIAGLPISAQQKELLRNGMQAAKDIASGKNVAKSIVDTAVKGLPPEYAKAVQVGMAMGHAKSLQSALKTGAAEGASYLSKGDNFKRLTSGTKNMNFGKMASVIGSSKAGIQKAIGAAQALQNKSPIIGEALKQAVSHYASGSPGHIGFSTAINVLKKTAGNQVALGVARRALPNEAARQAFDAAIGTVAAVVQKNPGALARRAGSSFVPQLSAPKGILSVYQPAMKSAMDAIKRNPTLAAAHPMVLAQKLGTSQQTVIDAMKKVGSQRLLPWRSMSPNAARFVQKWNPYSSIKALTHGTSDTAGLDETGTKYIVEKGDFPFKIAQKLTGNGNRWTELKALNTDKKPDITKNVWVGEVLNIPASWQKPIAKPAASNTPATSSQPAPARPTATPVAAPSLSVAPGILQAKSILVAWGKTDGLNEAGVSNYGSTAADLSTDFGPRDSLQLKSFQNWSNKTSGAKLAVDGKLGPKSLAALQSWAETKAAQVTSAASPTVTTLPEVVIEGTVPTKSTGIPQLPAPVLALPVPSTPSPVVVVSAPVPVAPTPSVPVVTPPSQPAVAAASPKSEGSKLGPALAGAAVGGTLFGLPGAILGGIAGAAIS